MGAGASIGNGGTLDDTSFTPIDGTEVAPDVFRLTPEGRIEYYAPGANMEKDKPTLVIEGTYGSETGRGGQAGSDVVKTDVQDNPTQNIETAAAPLYRVTDGEGRDISYVPTQQDGVLTIAADAELAVLTGTLEGISTLRSQGVKRIVFVTRSAASSFALSDLLAKGGAGDPYRLTHNGAAVTFTLGAGNIGVSDLL